MRVSTVSYLAVAQVATAQLKNSPTPTNPATIGRFERYGCASLEDGLDGLTLTSTDQEMSLELCGSTCQEIPDTPGFGVVGV